MSDQKREQIAVLAESFNTLNFKPDPPLDKDWEDVKKCILMLDDNISDEERVKTLIAHGKGDPKAKDAALYSLPWHYFPEFRKNGFVSPYSITANNTDNGILIFLQDWSSHETLGYTFGESPNSNVPKESYEDVARDGFNKNRQTNIRLSKLIRNYLGSALQIGTKAPDGFDYEALKSVYVSNIFPFIKRGGISAGLNAEHVSSTSIYLAQRLVAILQPKLIICLGSASFETLCDSGYTESWNDFVKGYKEPRHTFEVGALSVPIWPQRHTSRDKVKDNESWSAMAKWFADNR